MPDKLFEVTLTDIIYVLVPEGEDEDEVIETALSDHKYLTFDELGQEVSPVRWRSTNGGWDRRDLVYGAEETSLEKAWERAEVPTYEEFRKQREENKLKKE